MKGLTENRVLKRKANAFTLYFQAGFVFRVLCVSIHFLNSGVVMRVFSV
jgi:hypothetical protein